MNNFSFFHNVFYSQIIVSPFFHISDIISLFVAELEELRISILGKGLTHYLTTNFRLFQTERVCRLHFRFDENGSKLSKPVENIVGKGEIACYEQFLLFPQCFQKACFPRASKGVIVWERLNTI